MNAAEIKQRISIEQVVAHYGGNLNDKGVGQCLCPENHKNGDKDPSMRNSAGIA